MDRSGNPKRIYALSGLGEEAPPLAVGGKIHWLTWTAIIGSTLLIFFGTIRSTMQRRH